MNVQQIVESIEHAAERCNLAATAVHTALDAMDLGFIGGLVQSFLGSSAPGKSLHGRLPVLPLRAKSTPSLENNAPERVHNGNGHRGNVERIGKPAIGLKPTSNAVAEPIGTTTPVATGAEKAESDSAFIVELKRTVGALPRARTPIAVQSPIDRLRDALANGENPVVKGAYEANDILNHVETMILPKVEFLAEEYRDKTIESHVEKIARLAKMRDKTAKFIETIVYTGMKDERVKGISPNDAATLLNIVLGRGRESLIGIVVSYTALTEIGAILQQIASRLRARLAFREPNYRTMHENATASIAMPAADVAGTPQHATDTEEYVDFVILTAIDVELWAIRDVFGLTASNRVKKGTRVYWRGKVTLDNGEFYSIVVAQAADMANANAALSTQDMIRDWNPGAALLVGIAASVVPDKVKLGDVVVGSDIYYHERGKTTGKRTLPEPKNIAADATLLNMMRSLEWDGAVDEIRPDGSEEVSNRHIGVIACGEKVIASKADRNRIAQANRKIIAIEMEGYGFSLAISQNSEKVHHLVIRGICDDGSASKNDKWHKYAAMAAASLTRRFLLDRPLQPRNV